MTSLSIVKHFFKNLEWKKCWANISLEAVKEIDDLSTYNFPNIRTIVLQLFHKKNIC